MQAFVSYFLQKNKKPLLLKKAALNKYLSRPEIAIHKKCIYGRTN